MAKAKHKDALMIWLLGIYGVDGILNPVVIVGDHIGTHTLRWPASWSGSSCSPALSPSQPPTSSPPVASTPAVDA